MKFVSTKIICNSYNSSSSSQIKSKIQIMVYCSRKSIHTIWKSRKTNFDRVFDAKRIGGSSACESGACEFLINFGK